MSAFPNYIDQFLLMVLPYVAFFTFFLVTIQRYRLQSFTYSSLSSQFLENEHHFWSLVPFHYGIIAVLAGHLIGFLIPRQVLLWNSHPLRLFVLELSGLTFGVLAVLGMASIMIRRFTMPRVRVVTSTADWVLYILLLFQVVGGVYIAVFYPWGSSWFAAAAAPYLWSLLKLNPDISYVAALPVMVKLHIINAYLVIGFFPFTRLVHVLVAPNPYLWRRPQVVRWYGKRSQARRA